MNEGLSSVNYMDLYEGNVPISESNNSTLTHNDASLKILKCWYTNADSLINKLDELKARVDLFHPDIICVTEVFPKNCLFDVALSELHIDGYDCFCSEFGVHNRGVCIYVRSILHAQKHQQFNDVEFHECLFCTVSLASSDRVLIGVVYRSPNSGEANDVGNSSGWQLRRFQILRAS